MSDSLSLLKPNHPSDIKVGDTIVYYGDKGLRAVVTRTDGRLEETRYWGIFYKGSSSELYLRYPDVGWYIPQEQPYDPTQVGDTEDDI